MQSLGDDNLFYSYAVIPEGINRESSDLELINHGSQIQSLGDDSLFYSYAVIPKGLNRESSNLELIKP